MLAVPRAFLTSLHLEVGSVVGLEVEDGELVVRPQRKRYTLDALLAQCDLNASVSDEDRAWAEEPPVGRELA